MAQPADEATQNKKKELLPLSEYSLRELLLSTCHLTQDRPTALMLQAYPPDILIEIPRNTCSTFEFYKAKELIEVGRHACPRALAGAKQTATG